jgi:hypothetical protein
MKFKITLWLSLVVFTLHNIEECFTMRNFYLHHSDAIPAFARRFAQPVPDNVFLMMILLVTLAGIVMLAVGTRKENMFWAMVWVSGGILVNGLHHIALSLFFLSYTPGVATSVTLLLPYSIFLFMKMHTGEMIGRKQLIWSFITGAGLMGPVIFCSKILAQCILSFF